MSSPVQDEWMECERELHATAMPDVERYENDLRTLRAQVDGLKDLETLEQLVEAWRGPAAADSDRRSRLARGAAFALRAREIDALARGRLIEERIVHARAAGEQWVVLQQTGDGEAAVATPFNIATMHLDSGLATLAMAQYGAMTNSLVYSLTVIRLHSESGVLIDATPGLEDWMETKDRGELDAAVALWRQRIETGNIAIPGVGADGCR
ncbi:hypothetical protein CAF53_01940 [Sphingobium sp. LB126]|nr:hypothetical protein CAF53_01940 [Sphingobium sp. LB126]